MRIASLAAAVAVMAVSLAGLRMGRYATSWTHLVWVGRKIAGRFQYVLREVGR